MEVGQQCPSQDLDVGRMESGLRRILQDCRTFRTPESNQTEPKLEVKNLENSKTFKLNTLASLLV